MRISALSGTRAKTPSELRFLGAQLSSVNTAVEGGNGREQRWFVNLVGVSCAGLKLVETRVGVPMAKLHGTSGELSSTDPTHLRGFPVHVGIDTLCGCA